VDELLTGSLLAVLSLLGSRFTALSAGLATVLLSFKPIADEVLASGTFAVPTGLDPAAFELWAGTLEGEDWAADWVLAAVSVFTGAAAVVGFADVVVF